MANDPVRWNSTKKKDAANARAREIANAVFLATENIRAEQNRLSNEIDNVRRSVGAHRAAAGPGLDPVNHPSHYTSGGVEVIDAIEAWGLGFNLGNTVKYVARAGKKDPAKLVEDLKKARFYLDREILRMEKL